MKKARPFSSLVILIRVNKRKTESIRILYANFCLFCYHGNGTLLEQEKSKKFIRIYIGMLDHKDSWCNSKSEPNGKKLLYILWLEIPFFGLDLLNKPRIFSSKTIFTQAKWCLFSF